MWAWPGCSEGRGFRTDLCVSGRLTEIMGGNTESPLGGMTAGLSTVQRVGHLWAAFAFKSKSGEFNCPGAKFF